MIPAPRLSAPDRARRWLDARRAVLVPVGLVGTAILVIGVATWAGRDGTRLGLVVSIGCDVVAAVVAGNVARRLPAGDPARRFWWAMCAATALIALGYGQTLAAVAGLGLVGWSSAGLVMPGVAAAIVVGVLLTYRSPLRSPRDRACFWLDMGTVLVGGAAFGWYFSAGAAESGTASLVGLVTGPAPLLVAVFAVTKVLISGRPPFGTVPGLLGAASAAVGAVVSLTAAGVAGPGGWAWTPALSALGDGLLLAAIWVQRRQVDADPQALSRLRRRPYSVLPYVALALTFGLLVIALVGSAPPGRTWTVLACVALSVALVVARQLAAFTDNARLLAELDVRVRELNAALRQRDLLATSLRAMAFRDSLTGLANRALFEDKLTAELKRMNRDGGCFGVLLLDLDGFKPVNDEYGHAVGDSVLQIVAERLTEQLREIDTVARLGGDEFAVLLPMIGAGGAEVVAERLVAAVAAPCPLPGGEVVVGVSVGVVYGGPGSTPQQLLHDADRAMYSVKSRGKNGYAVTVAAR